MDLQTTYEQEHDLDLNYYYELLREYNYVLYFVADKYRKIDVRVMEAIEYARALVNAERFDLASPINTGKQKTATGPGTFLLLLSDGSYSVVTLDEGEGPDVEYEWATDLGNEPTQAKIPRIEVKRRQKRFTKKEMAVLARTDLSYYCKIEKGKAIPGYMMRNRIAEILDCFVGDLWEQREEQI